MSEHTISLKVDASAAESALAQLGLLAKSFPDSVERFLNSGLDLSQVICINSGDGAASRAGEFRISLDPSDGLRKFLAAFPTGNVE